MTPAPATPDSRNSDLTNPSLVRIRLEPLGVELDVPLDASLVSALAAHGVEFPCGGVGECGARPQETSSDEAGIRQVRNPLGMWLTMRWSVVFVRVVFPAQSDRLAVT